MQIISILAAGVNGAESGQATISVRGTSTPATTYASFEGDSPNTTGVVVLDANGGATVYVNQYVDVDVVSSQGAAVRSFTQGDATSVQEYIGQSFKGPGYVGGPEAINQAITTQAVFNRWIDSAGAPDWEVLLEGTAQPLTTALGNLPGLVFNVKNAAYGAVGDGVVDDTTAIAAAMTAASAGGIVFFPRGTYRLTSALSPGVGVSLKGVGSSESKLVMDSSTANLLTPAVSDGIRCTIEDLSLTSSQNCTGSIILISDRWESDISRCVIGDAFNTVNFVDAKDEILLDIGFHSCVFGAPGATGQAITTAASLGEVRLRDCRFVTPATYNVTTALVYGVGLKIEGCFFDTSASASGTFSVYATSSPTLRSTIVGCNFSDSGGATVTGIELGQYAAAARFVESANVFPLDNSNGWTAYSYDGGTGNPDGAIVSLITRETRVEALSGSGATQVVDAKQYGISQCVRTGTANVSIDDADAEQLPEGASYTVVIDNGGGGAITTVSYNINGMAGDTTSGGLANGNVTILSGKVTRSGFAGNRLYVLVQKDV